MWRGESLFAGGASSASDCGILLLRRSIKLAKKSVYSKVLAVVGGDSLLGKEVRELIDNKQLPAQVKLIAAAGGEPGGILTEQKGEPAVMTTLQKDDIRSSGVALLAGPPDSSRKAHE